VATHAPTQRPHGAGVHVVDRERLTWPAAMPSGWQVLASLGLSVGRSNRDIAPSSDGATTAVDNHLCHK